MAREKALMEAREAVSRTPPTNPLNQEKLDSALAEVETLKTTLLASQPREDDISIIRTLQANVNLEKARAESLASELARKRDQHSALERRIAALNAHITAINASRISIST